MEQLIHQDTDGWNRENFCAYLRINSYAKTRQTIISWIATNIHDNDAVNSLVRKFRIFKIKELDISRERIELPVRKMLENEARRIMQ